MTVITEEVPTGSLKESVETTHPNVDMTAPASGKAEAANTTTVENGDDDASERDITGHKNMCGLCDVNGNSDAIGYSWLAAGRGVFTMSNIYMYSSLLSLAANAAGCFDDDESSVTGETCTKKIYGFTPSGLLSNVFVIAGLASAFFMPICGALVDYTDYRRGIGIGVSMTLLAIQAVQVFTMESTWFPMLILQCMTVVIYQLQIVAVYAYLIEICNVLGQAKMTGYSSNMTALQFVCQVAFLAIMVVISLALNSTAVRTAQISQSLNVLINSFVFAVGWFKYMTTRKAVHELPQGRNLLTEGFRQNWATAKKINRNFRKGLRWFFFALVFAEAASQAIGTTSIIYLSDTLKLDTVEVGIFFLVTLLTTVLGTRIAVWVTLKSNPNTSWKLNMSYLFVVIGVGVLVLDFLPKYCTFIWGAFVGIGLGWFYPTENLFFSVCVPRGQEAELSGFFVYCSQILAWLPPLLFTVCLESGLEQKFALLVVDCFFLVAIGLLCCVDSWEVILAEVASNGEPNPETGDEPPAVASQ